VRSELRCLAFSWGAVLQAPFAQVHMVLACWKQLLFCAGDVQVYQSKGILWQGSCAPTAWPEKISQMG